MKKTFKVIGIFIIILALVVSISMVLAQNAPPPQVVADFTELDKIIKISKFRSCAGHTTVPQDRREMKRSMKHYYGVKPEYLGSDTVEIYSPFDGFVTTIRSEPENGLEGEIWIVPKDAFVWLPPVGRWSFSVQHINVRNDLRRGSEVKAGELIGHAAVATENRDTFDVIYAKGSFIPKMIDNWRGPFIDLDSVFNHMSEQVFSKYKSRGVDSKEELILSKEERDQKPCTYKDNGPYFLNQDATDNWVVFQ